ncbi:MAG: DUF91 domain-containing protein [Candidatus Aenigmarchaeota archaeon]|nr:DUF91 domain-containing protein [Candidatus Aenigmarchaeota archaeon]
MVNIVVEAIREAADSFGKGVVFSHEDVISYIKKAHPERDWSEQSIRAQTLLLCINKKSSAISHPSVYKYAFLFYVDRNKIRLYDPEKDGTYENGGKNIMDEESNDDMESEDEIYEISFGFEKNLEDYICRNLDQIENGLKIYSNGGINGRQFSMDIGRIDILATDSKGGFVVIELKLGVASYKVIGQILSYMSWVRKNIANGKAIRGIVISDDFDDKTKYAAEEIPSLVLKRYKAKFEFEDV